MFRQLIVKSFLKSSELLWIQLCMGGTQFLTVAKREVAVRIRGCAALTSDGMIEPSYWIDPKTGNNYMLTVQYFDKQIQNMSMEDFKQIPLRAANIKNYTPLQSVADITQISTPTEVDHYQLQRVIDI